MKKLLVTILTILATNAHAAYVMSNVTCSFTEPFLTVKYDTTGKVLTIKNDVDHEMHEMRGVEMVHVGANKLRMGILEIELNWQGNNGMSDEITAFTGRLEGLENNEGACWTEYLRQGNSEQ